MASAYILWVRRLDLTGELNVRYGNAKFGGFADVFEGSVRVGELEAKVAVKCLRYTPARDM